MADFAEYFSDEAIIDRLCKLRLKQAASRHKRLFHRQLVSTVELPEIPEAVDVLPPRRQWARFRNYRASRSLEMDENLIALKRATSALRWETPTLPWAERLRRRIEGIRRRALEDAAFIFAPPTIRPVEKSPDSDEFRAIASFTPDDQIIEGITAKYLRETFEHLFSASSLAFRCQRDGVPPPTHHTAVTKLENYRRRHLRTGLYVAECDIRGFFDCVSHDVATNALTDLIRAATAANPQSALDSRAFRIFDAYLKCYSFPHNVKAEAEAELKDEKGAQAYFKWPEEELGEFHADPRAVRVGIPQGGGLSCFIANAVLHHADLEVKRCRSRTPGPYRYLRYCDDMVILAPQRETCQIVFEAYQEALKRCLLPAHPPQPVEQYASGFWKGKSRRPYQWARPKDTSTVPWLQFVGYQLRHDGMMRVKKKSIQKHKEKLREETDRLLRTLTTRPSPSVPNVSGFAPGIRKNADQIIHRFRKKLIAISVGRREAHDDLARAMPKCWAAGFKAIHGKRIPLNTLKELDRYRERQIARIIRRLRDLPPTSVAQGTSASSRPPSFYGFPFSHVAQFKARRRE